MSKSKKSNEVTAHVALYNQLRSIPLKTWKERKVSDLNGEAKNLGQSLIIAAKLAHQETVEVFSEFMTSHELPAIKLTNAELEFLQGGFFGWGHFSGSSGGGFGSPTKPAPAIIGQGISQADNDIMSGKLPSGAEGQAMKDMYLNANQSPGTNGGSRLDYMSKTWDFGSFGKKR